MDGALLAVHVAGGDHADQRAGVPALGIHGRYFTSGQLAGSPERALVVADALIERSRKGG